ncbi:transglutaminase domain protein [Desulfatibacillum aliphaticivorans]|uniref:Transglutaminase domain protein n=1 Tax=Desulfatibacillum aliphaticivorans TaxID=218208 RepID=B8FBD2_DESAL|nr:transglutaminase-like domain-containing protein [Desulfatibacillum aliphaticivorans]ACL04576.1 transglutaminase domain protein [Desulfatibacillum aliphaticivorans]
MKNRWTWVAGLAFILIFAALFSIRVGYFDKEVEVPENFLDVERGFQDDSRTFMDILQNGKKIGYVDSSFIKTDDGWLAKETAYMELNALGTVQKTTLTSGAHLNPDMTLRSMGFKMKSDLGSFDAKAWMDGDVLKVETGVGEARQVMEFPMESPPLIDAGLMHLKALRELKPGEKAAYPIFDPATMTNYKVAIKMVGPDSIKILGETIPAKKLEMAFMGQTQTTWISEDGEMLAQEGLMGLRLEKTTRDLAMEETSFEKGDDLFALAAIPVDTPLMSPQKLTMLKVRVTGADHFAEKLNQGRQTFEDGVLTVKVEPLPDPGLEVPYTGDPAFLGSDSFIQSNHPEVVELAHKIVNENDAPQEKVRKIIQWGYEELEKTPVLSMPQALETLRTRKGDCGEHAMLMAALARAVGVPAQVNMGLYYVDGVFGFHAWNSFYVNGQWITGDATVGQFPVDAAHLQFAQGGYDVQLEVAGLIGRLTIEVLEQKK